MTKRPTRTRKRVGRPPRPEPAERVVVYLSVALKRKLQHRAVDLRSSLSDLVAEAVRDYLRRPRRGVARLKD